MVALDLLKTMEDNSTDINTNYFTMVNSNYSNYNNNQDTITQIVTALNSNIAELNYIQNQMSIANNLNQENLVKQQELLKMQNEDLNNQLRELEIIQSTIANKDRYIDQVNDNITNQNLNIRVLVISILLAILLLVIIVLFGYGVFQYFQFVTLLIIIVLCYLILFLYSYNIFHFRDSIDGLSGLNKNLKKLDDKLNKWSSTVNHELRNELYGLESAWVNNHCSCPESEEDNSNNNNSNNVYAEDANVSQAEIPGHFYYDGTAPQQLITPFRAGLNEDINWVDYSPSGLLRYSKGQYTATNENNNYYNANSKNSRERGNILNNLKNELDSMPSYLVNNYTATANL
jgi:hypothetical protein